jgi:hypothetical protein
MEVPFRARPWHLALAGLQQAAPPAPSWHRPGPGKPQTSEKTGAGLTALEHDGLGQAGRR